jgi:tripeptide aminopeptidase
MDVLERFLTYVKFDTQSSEETGTTPSTEKQLKLADHLCSELKELGLEDALRDEFGCVYAHLPASPGMEGVAPFGLIAHMDTAPAASGTDVKARVEPFTGEPIVLNKEKNIVLSPRDFPSLMDYVGQELVVTDGTTLLGADDKAGVAEIVSTVEYLIQNPQVKHGVLCIAFTPDEEIGEGSDHFNLEQFGAKTAYTVDGGALGELEYENFNAASARIRFHGRNIHPGEAKGKMINAALLAAEYVNLLPPAEAPAHTEGYEGFFHVTQISGDETEAEVRLIVRDHHRERFEARKALLEVLAQPLRSKYGAERVELTVEDSYYNMREKIEPHMELITRAKAAFAAAGVEACTVPIRGGTDGAQLSYRGLPCPNLSTGGVNFHGVFEYLPVESLRKMVEVLVALSSLQGE